MKTVVSSSWCAVRQSDPPWSLTGRLTSRGSHSPPQPLPAASWSSTLPHWSIKLPLLILECGTGRRAGTLLWVFSLAMFLLHHYSLYTVIKSTGESAGASFTTALITLFILPLFPSEQTHYMFFYSTITSWSISDSIGLLINIRLWTESLLHQLRILNHTALWLWYTDS